MNDFKKNKWSFTSIEEALKCFEIKDGCHLWTEACTSGYGVFKVNGKTYSAHRESYRKHYGEIPKAHMICHKCGIRECINPEHLYPGTHQDNVRDRSKDLLNLKILDQREFEKNKIIKKTTSLNIPDELIDSFNFHEHYEKKLEPWEEELISEFEVDKSLFNHLEGLLNPHLIKCTNPKQYKSRSKRISMIFPEDLFNKLKILSTLFGGNMSDFIRIAIYEKIKRIKDNSSKNIV